MRLFNQLSIRNKVLATAALMMIAVICLAIVAYQCITSAAGEATAAQRMLLGSATLATVAGFVAAIIIANNLTQRVEMMSRVITDITDGYVDKQYDLPPSGDELGKMATALTTMTRTMRKQMAILQQMNADAKQLRDVEVASRERLEQAVTEYLHFTQQVAQGTLNQRLTTKHDGAIGQLGQGLNDMAASLQRITTQVQQASAAIASSAAEILASTAQQAASATEQSAAITQTTTTVEEVKAIAQQTAHQATQLVQQGHHLLNTAQRGTDAVEQTVDGMGLIKERVDSIAHTILALSEQTAAISEITTTVTDLADQSNLLALNAAIEAARAGEQGKGFAVVAQHVRDLAERSKGATAQVREILNEIQRATSAAVMVTEEGTKGVTQGAGLAGQAGQVIAQIARDVESGAQANVQVAAAAQQQTAGMDQIGQAMSAIQQATTESLSSTRQAERAAKDLTSLAQSLQQVVAAYRV